MCNAIRALVVVLCSICFASCSVEPRNGTDWSALGTKLRGTFSSGVHVQSELAGAIELAAPLSQEDVYQASLIIAEGLIDNDFEASFELLTCELDGGSAWRAVFKRRGAPSDLVSILFDVSGYVQEVKVGFPRKTKRPPMYAEIVSSNRFLAETSTDERMTAALCARDIAGLLNYLGYGWEVTSVVHDEQNAQWTIFVFLQCGYGAEVVLSSDWSLQYYKFITVDGG